MANNYLQFSAALENLNKEEVEWLEKVLHDDNDDRFPDLDFQWEIQTLEGTDNTIIWFHADEAGEPSHVAQVVQSLFQKFPRWEGKTWYFTWAATCEKPRIGEFSGGGVVVTTKECFYMEAENWARNKVEELSKQKSSVVKGKTASTVPSNRKRRP